MNPNQPFQSEGQSQFQQQYPYPQGTSAFSMDQEMTMGPDNFAASVRAHAGAALEHSAAESGPNQGATNLNTSATGMNGPGMAPPQAAGHPYSPGGPRTSIDDSGDGGLSGGDPKRKRSKVSRACDECRRKKVRCDAVAEDGSIKTCANCTRAGLTCEYSRIPMKRGPSKGYIKELSERVQQVESLQMALSNTPGYRQSLDASSGVYAEQPYSPDDPMSLKRNFSFSAEQRSPFVAPEFNRDRMPSVSWNSASPHSAVFRARDRGSIAIAPDQQPSNPISFAKPFWAQDTEGPPPAKRQRMDSDQPTKPELGQELLSKYYDNVHGNFSILPNADATIAIVEKASVKVQHAFVAAITNLPPSTLKSHNGTNNQQSSSGMTSKMFESRQELEDFMWNSARESPDARSAEDNLLYLWTYLLMAVEAERDLRRLHDGTLPRTVLIKQAVDLGWSCVTAAADTSQLPTEADPVSRPPYLFELARAWHCASILARLHAVAVSSSNPIPRYWHQYMQKNVPDTTASLTLTSRVIAQAASQLTVVSGIVQAGLPFNQWGRNVDIQFRLSLQEWFDNNIDISTQRPGNETLLNHLRYFLDLTLSRFTINFHPMDIVNPAGCLANELHKHLTASGGAFAYNPLNLHFFTLTTITLLEFLSEQPDTELYRVAKEGVEDIKNALEQISERDHIDNEAQLDDSEAGSSEIARKPMHWSDVLLKMIEGRQKSVAAAHANGAPSSGIRRLGDGSSAAVDFSLLLRHGYLTVLAQQVD